MGRPVIRARRANSSIADRMWRSGTGMTRVRTAERFRPVPGRDEPWRTPELAVWSGDTVVTDDEGFLYFVGRKDDMIKTSGYRVSPTEIEEVAYATGLVRDAVALGVEDATLGQRVRLVVAPRRNGVRHRRAARGDEVPAAAVHGAQLSCGSRCDSALAQRQVRPGTVARGVGHVSLRPMIAAFGSIDGQLAVGGMPLDRLTARVGSTPYFAYDRRLLTERIEVLRATLPPTLHLSYAVKANPMPAVVQHLAGLVDALDVASTLEMQTALDTPMPAGRISFAGPGKTAAEIVQAVAAGVTIEMESATEARRVIQAGEMLGVRPRVAVRVNPDFQVKGSGMRMGGGPQQFGVDAEQVPEFLADLAAADLEFRRVPCVRRIAEPQRRDPV